jgi:ornithine decarboxylase
MSTSTIEDKRRKKSIDDNDEPVIKKYKSITYIDDVDEKTIGQKMQEGLFSIDATERLTIIDIKEELPNKIYKFDMNTDILDIISYFLELKNSDDPFYIVDINEIYKKCQQWFTVLPNILPYYAIKSNPDPVIIKTLAKLGCGGDCASKDEIILAQSAGIPNDKILYANPCKNNDSLQFARSQDVDYLTFDSRCELDKIKVFHPDAKCILRIKVDDEGSECKFSTKFGCTLEEAKDLLALAKLDELEIVGVSFHQGSNCKVLGQFQKAISDARIVFDMGKEYGFNMNILDIGGGFPGTDDGPVTFEQLGKEINESIDIYFNDIPDIKIIAEPGRFMNTSSHTLVCTIIGIKSSENKETGEKEYKYTINDTIYGSFNCIMFDYAKPKILPYNERNEKTYKSTIFGCSCDSLDVITREVYLPKHAVGDRLYVQNFGSYTVASSSSFNGFKTSIMHYIIRA